jgi:hypothetical protein
MIRKRDFEEQLVTLVEDGVSLAKRTLEKKSLRFGYVPHVVETLQVQDKPGIQMSSIARSFTAKCEFHRDDFHRLLNEIEELSSYKKTMELIESRKKKPLRSPGWIIKSMMISVIKETILAPLDDFYERNQQSILKAIDGSLDTDKFGEVIANAQSELEAKLESIEPRVLDYAKAVTNELLGHKRIYKIVMWMTGLYVDGHEIRGRGFVFRAPTSTELTFTYPFGGKSIWGDGTNRIIPTSILEIKLKARDQPGLSQMISKLEMSLKLFKGSINYWRYVATPDDVDYDQDIMGNLDVRNTSGVRIGLADKNELIFHLQELPKLMPEEMMRWRVRQNTGLVVAYNMYEKSVREFSPQNVANNAVIGLESMYLELDYKRDKGPRLAKLVSSILENEGFSGSDVRKIVGNAYKRIRNKMSHGSPLNGDDRLLAAELAGPLINYLRNSIIILLKDKRQDFYTKSE